MQRATTSIPPIRNTVTMEYLEGRNLSHDHNNLVRIYEILMANSLGNNVLRYTQEYRTQETAIDYSDSFEDTDETQQPMEVTINTNPYIFHNYANVQMSPFSPNYASSQNSPSHLDEYYSNAPFEPTPREFNCPTCGRTFHEKIFLDVHEFLHVPVEYPDYFTTCNMCDLIFTDEYFLHFHQQRYHQATCKLCGLIFTNEDNLHLHLQQHYEVQLKASESFTQENISNSEESEQKSETIPFLCEVCGKNFNHFKKLRMHQYFHLESEQKSETMQFPCKACGENFKHFKKWRKHRLSHLVERPSFICAYCDRTYRRKHILQAHITKNHILNLVSR